MSDDGVRASERIIVFDTTLRDGEQSPGATLTADEKLEVADALVALGVDVMEAGFPAASPGDFEAVRAIAKRAKGVTVAGLARLHQVDIERAAQAVKESESPRIHTFIATSDIHLQHKLRLSREEVLERVEAMVRLAKAFASDVEFSAEDATRSDWDYLVEVFGRAVAAGATTINVPDTVGYTTPGEYAALIAHLRERVPGVEGVGGPFFNEFTLRLPKEARPVVRAMAERGVLGGVSLGRLYPGVEALQNGLVVAVAETTTDEDIAALEAALKEVVR